MVSHAVWITWPSGLSDDKNLGLRPRFRRDTESFGPRFSHGMGDYDQILQQSSNSSCVSHTGASWCENFHRLFKSLCWLYLCVGCQYHIPVHISSMVLRMRIWSGLAFHLLSQVTSEWSRPIRDVTYVAHPEFVPLKIRQSERLALLRKIACWFLHITFQNSIIPTKSQQCDGLIFNIQQNGVK